MSERSLRTRERLLDAAERLFGERGFEAVSLRAVTEAADANIAAVNYHFGSKDGLLRAVVERVMAPVNAERARRLAALEARDGTPSVPELVRAFIEPAVHLAESHGERAPAVARFIGRVLSEPGPRVRQLFAEEVDPVEGRYLAALRDGLPEADDETVRFVYAGMLGLLGLHQSGAFHEVEWPELPDASPRGGAADAERLIRFVVAGIRAVTSVTPL